MQMMLKLWLLGLVVLVVTVNRLAEHLPEQIRTLVIDTTTEIDDLSINRIVIGQSVTAGNSTGSNEDVGRRVAQADSSQIREAISGARSRFLLLDWVVELDLELRQ